MRVLRRTAAVEEALERATRVFSGEVIEIVDPGKNKWICSSNEPIEVIVKVDRVWKGNVGRQATVTTALSTASCGYPFAIGESYLIYASDLGETDTNLCGRTAKLSNAEADLLVLGEGDIPATPSSTKSEHRFPAICGGRRYRHGRHDRYRSGLWRFLARRKEYETNFTGICARAHSPPLFSPPGSPWSNMCSPITGSHGSVHIRPCCP